MFRSRKGKETYPKHDSIELEEIQRRANSLYPVYENLKLNTTFIKIATSLATQFGETEAINRANHSLHRICRYADVLEDNVARYLLEWNIPHIRDFKNRFIQKACHLLESNALLEMDVVVDRAHFDSVLWYQLQGLEHEIASDLRIQATKQISLSDWRRDQQSCLKQIDDLKKCAVIKKEIAAWLILELKRIQNYGYTWLMSEDYTQHKTTALVNAIAQIPTTDNYKDLCEVIYCCLLQNPKIYSGRLKDIFAFTQESRESSQIKNDLDAFIKKHKMADMLNEVAVEIDAETIRARQSVI